MTRPFVVPPKRSTWRSAAVALMPDDPGALDVLAAEYASAERFDEAIQTASQAIAAAVEAGQTTLAAQIRARVARFRQHRPFVLP